MMERAQLQAWGIDPDDFERKTEACEAVFTFVSVALGCPDNVVRCQMRGEHTLHKAIYYGIPYNWDDEGRLRA
jgi:hypothetical protein